MNSSDRRLSRRIGWLWATVTLVCLVIAGLNVLYVLTTREVLERESLQQAAFFARVVDAQFTRAVSGAGTTLRVAANAVEAMEHMPDQAQDGSWLVDQIAGQPLLRSLSLVTADGLIVASSASGNAGLRIAPAQIGCSGISATDARLGAFILARDLADLAPGAAGISLTGVLPMRRPARTRDGTMLCVVALLNLDRFATESEALLEGDASGTALFSLDGQLLSASSRIQRTPGARLGQLAPFAAFLPEREFGSYAGIGVDGVSVLGGFRASRSWPLVTVVEQAPAAVDRLLLKEATWPVVAGLGIVLIVVAVGLAEQANLRREAAASARAAALTREIAESDARSRAIFEHAGVGMLQQDADGRVLRVNPALCQLLDYSVQEFLALRPADLIHPDDLAPPSPSAPPGYASMGTESVGERRLRRSDGSYLWVRMTTSVGTDAKGHIYTIGVVEDISERRQAQIDLVDARQRELHIGASIQRALLVPPPDQQLPGVWLSALSIASQGIDGDFIEVMPIGDKCVDIVAGDVMGKGLGAALMGAGIKMLVSRCIAQLVVAPTHLGAAPSPAEIVAALHRAATADLQALESFVTLCYLRIDTAANTVTWVGCGHEEPMLVHKAGGCIRLSNQHAPIGVLDDVHYTQRCAPFERGDGLLLFSDGVVDALTPTGDRVGRERLAATIEARVRAHDTPAAILHALRRDLLGGGVRHTDDVTMLLAMRTDDSQVAVRHEYPTVLESVGPIWRTVNDESRRAGLDEVGAGLFATACVEAFTNIVRHNWDTFSGAPTELVARRGNGGIEVDLIHQGNPFVPPARIETPPLDAFPQGGFGLAIMHDVASDVAYSHHAGVNVIRLTRRATSAT